MEAGQHSEQPGKVLRFRMVDNINNDCSRELVNNMAISISPVKAEDVDLLVRKVEYPAHLDGPLYRLMFPLSYEQQGWR